MAIDVEMWKVELFSLARSNDQDAQRRIGELIDRVRFMKNVEVSSSLVKLFYENIDDNFKEAALSCLHSQGYKLAISSITQEISSLASCESEWVESIIGPELQNRPEEFIDTINELSDFERQNMKTVISENEFLEEKYRDSETKIK